MNKLVIVTGIKQIDRKLRTLEPRVQKKVVRQAIRKGLKLIQSDVKANAPVKYGITKANVQTRAVKKRQRGNIEIEVKIGGNDDRLYKIQADGTKVFYPAIVEYKHDPFMRRSFDNKGEAARQVTLQALMQGIMKEVRAGGSGSGGSSGGGAAAGGGGGTGGRGPRRDAVTGRFI